MKIYLGHLSRRSEETGDLRRLSEILVSLTLTCRRLNNSLEQGMTKILRYVFTLPRRVLTNQQLIVAIMAELNRSRSKVRAVIRVPTIMRALVALIVLLVMETSAEDRCPRPDEIAPCQCRTRGPSIQVR